ncbi:MAG TPA: hypothetical protein VGA49_03610 [Patescibacteria group bacterium]
MDQDRGFKPAPEKKWPRYLLMAGLIVFSVYLFIVLILFLINYFALS